MNCWTKAVPPHVIVWETHPRLPWVITLQAKAPLEGALPTLREIDTSPSLTVMYPLPLPAGTPGGP